MASSLDELDDAMNEEDDAEAELKEHKELDNNENMMFWKIVGDWGRGNFSRLKTIRRAGFLVKMPDFVWWTLLRVPVTKWSGQQPKWANQIDSN